MASHFVFIIGIIHWCLFINYGDSQFNYFSWKVTYPFFDVIKQSGEVFKIPYHVTYYDVPLAQYGDSIYQSKNGTYDIRFFANGFSQNTCFPFCKLWMVNFLFK